MTLQFGYFRPIYNWINSVKIEQSSINELNSQSNTIVLPILESLKHWSTASSTTKAHIIIVDHTFQLELSIFLFIYRYDIQFIETSFSQRLFRLSSNFTLIQCNTAFVQIQIEQMKTIDPKNWIILLALNRIIAHTALNWKENRKTSHGFSWLRLAESGSSDDCNWNWTVLDPQNYLPIGMCAVCLLFPLSFHVTVRLRECA